MSYLEGQLQESLKAVVEVSEALQGCVECIGYMQCQYILWGTLVPNLVVLVILG